MTDLISITVADGKYTIREKEPYKWEALRYGEEWPGMVKSGGPDNLHIALAHEIDDIRRGLASVVSADPVLLAALKEAMACGMVPTSSALEGGAARYSRQARVADMIRAAIAKAEEKSTAQALLADPDVVDIKARLTALREKGYSLERAKNILRGEELRGQLAAASSLSELSAVVLALIDARFPAEKDTRP